MVGYLPYVVSETVVEKEEDQLVRFGGAGEVVDGDIVGTIHRGAVDEFDRGVVAPRTGAQDTENEFCVVEGLGGNVDPVDATRLVGALGVREGTKEVGEEVDGVRRQFVC